MIDVALFSRQTSANQLAPISLMPFLKNRIDGIGSAKPSIKKIIVEVWVHQPRILFEISIYIVNRAGPQRSVIALNYFLLPAVANDREVDIFHERCSREGEEQKWEIDRFFFIKADSDMFELACTRFGCNR